MANAAFCTDQAPGSGYVCEAIHRGADSDSRKECPQRPSGKRTASRNVGDDVANDPGKTEADETRARSAEVLADPHSEHISGLAVAPAGWRAAQQAAGVSPPKREPTGQQARTDAVRVCPQFHHTEPSRSRTYSGQGLPRRSLPSAYAQVRGI
jgi:hypothetical protein